VGPGRPNSGGAAVSVIPPAAAVGAGFRSAVRDAATLAAVGAESASDARFANGFSTAIGLAEAFGAGGYTAAQSSDGGEGGSQLAQAVVTPPEAGGPPSGRTTDSADVDPAGGVCAAVHRMDSSPSIIDGPCCMTQPAVAATRIGATSLQG